MLIKMVGLLWVVASLAVAQARPAFADDSLILARLQSFEAVTRLLLDHNPDLRGLIREQASEPVAQVYLRLQARTPEDAISTVVAEVLQIQRQLQFLEQLPASEESMLPGLLNPILAAHHRIDQVLASHDVPGGTAQTVHERIDQLTLEIARLGLLYQTRLFTGLMVHAEEPEGDVLGALDSSITRYFEQLEAQGLGQQELFQRSERNYRFVRSALLDQQANWVPNASVLYLNDAMRSLTRLRASYP